jgi:ATP-dependent helicase/nuclease subunit B
MRSALETVFFGWTYAPVFRYLKTDLVSVSRDEVDQLENYVLAHGIKGKRWIDGKPWDYQRVYAIGEKNQELSQVQRSELAYINKIKELAIRDLADFYMTVEQNSTIRGISAGLYTLINNLGIKDRLEDWATEARENKQLDRAREHAQIYNQVLLLLDEIVEALGDQESSAESYLKVLEAGLENLRLGLIPPGLDQVFIGSLDRSRNPEVRANFLIGINDGILPARPSAEGILTNQERELLLARGLNLAPDAKRCLFDEQYLVYLGLTRASEYLWISYALADQEGRALNPSVIIQDLQEVFPGIRVQDCPLEPAGVDCQEDLDFISAPRRSLTYLTVKLREANSGLDISSVWRDVYNALIMNNRYRVARSTAGLFYQNRERCLQPETVKRLYGSSLRAGITQIEQFNACPFAHFLKYGLRLKERETWKLRPMDLGQFFHAALKNFGERLNQDVPNWITITVEMCNQLVDEIILQLLPQLQNEIMISSVRQQYLGQKLLRIVRSSAWALVEQMRCGSFRPLAMEMGFGYPGELPALRIALENAIENSSVNSLENKISEQLVDALDTFKPIYTIAEDKAEGNCLELVGRIDRVDWAKSPAGSYLRVVDYKSGSAGINLNDIHHGLGLQLLTYLEVALNNAQQMAGEEAIPGGMLYFRIRKPMLAVKGQVAPEKIAQELRKVYKLKGLVLEDRDLIELMEKGLIGDSSIIPVGFKVNGEFKSRSAVLSRNQFAGLRRYLRQILKDTGRGILAGEADIQPYQRKKKKACGYCHLKSVCQFDTTVGNQYRVLQDLEDRLIWHLIGDGGEGS